MDQDDEFSNSFTENSAHSSSSTSSVASESTFSTGGNIVEKKQTKLMGENVEALTFIHYMLLMED